MQKLPHTIRTLIRVLGEKASRRGTWHGPTVIRWTFMSACPIREMCANMCLAEHGTMVSMGYPVISFTLSLSGSGQRANPQGREYAADRWLANVKAEPVSFGFDHAASGRKRSVIARVLWQPQADQCGYGSSLSGASEIRRQSHPDNRVCVPRI